jgi:hypothetical protein
MHAMSVIHEFGTGRMDCPVDGGALFQEFTCHSHNGRDAQTAQTLAHGRRAIRVPGQIAVKGHHQIKPIDSGCAAPARVVAVQSSAVSARIQIHGAHARVCEYVFDAIQHAGCIPKYICSNLFRCADFEKGHRGDTEFVFSAASVPSGVIPVFALAFVACSAAAAFGDAALHFHCH